MVFIKSNELPIGFFNPPVDRDFDPDTCDLDMQIVDWADGDGFNKIEGRRGKGERVYKIRMYGKTMTGHSVCVHVEGFNPYFYVKLPSNWDQNDLEDFIGAVKGKVKNGDKHWLVKELVKTELVFMETLYWYDKNQKYPFVKFSFKNKAGFYAFKRVFDEPLFVRNIDKVHPFDFKHALYQTNIEPKLRFMHERDLKAAGWIHLNAGKYEWMENEFTRCQMNVIVKWDQVFPDNDNTEIAPMTVASFDGEMKSEDGSFPVATRKGDPVIQIGTTVHRYGETDVSLSYIVTLGDCTDFAADDPNTLIECIPYDRNDPEDLLRAERKLLMTWAGFIERLDPDILTGYNIWGFDMKYLFIRVNEYMPYDPEDKYNLPTSAKQFLATMDRRVDWEVRGAMYIEKDLNSSGLGENKLAYFGCEGIVQIDVMKVVQGDVTKKLESYKLDFVSEKYLGDKKIDLSPRQMFENFEDGAPDKIAEIAEYCVKDCALCNRLMMKLAIDSNSIGMANVCSVPFSYIFMRGQGIKLFSLVVKQCNNEGILCPVLDKDLIDPSSYEGAIVFKPVPGIYEMPIEVLDYASLYPSSMIAENISHDSLVLVRTYDLEGNLLKEEGNAQFMDMEGYQYNRIVYDTFKKKGGTVEDVPDEIDFHQPTEDAFDYLVKGTKLVKKKSGKKKKKDDAAVKTGYKECFFIEQEGSPKEGKGILPRIEMALLQARRDTRKKIKYKNVVYTDTEGNEKTAVGLLGEVRAEDNEDIILGYKIKTEDQGVIDLEVDQLISSENTYTKFQQVILDGLQQAYKVTCNSLYGQVGATTSSICFKELAACTTAVGRNMLITAKTLIEEHYPGAVNVYGDTDSVFVDFTPYINVTYGKNLTIMEIRQKAMELGFEAGEYVTSHLKYPQDLEREKQFYPFIIFSKKRYIANKFEMDLTSGYQNSMGIATKRRDNARKLVAEIYGGTLGVILDEIDIPKAKEYFRDKVRKLLTGGFDLSQLKVTKSVKANSSYANPTSIAPRVLADRMYERDPGNKVMSNERLAYAFIDTCNLKCDCCGGKVNVNKCKCIKCMHLFCPVHLNNHRRQCTVRCRFCKEKSCPTIIRGNISRTKRNLMKIEEYFEVLEFDFERELIPQIEKQLDCEFFEPRGLFKCNTCTAYYCLTDMYKHRRKKDKNTGDITLTKCKKVVNQKISQGDRIETLPYITENGLKIDYMYYLDHQILNPSMQLFGLIIEKPTKLIEDILAEDRRKKKGMKSLASYGFFKQ